MFLEPVERFQTEIVVRRSRFLVIAMPARSPQEVREFLATIRADHRTADHVVHAALVGFPQREIASLSDAGEPRGTAGRPIMEVLKGSGIRNVLLAVVRYFGGTKLGTGGLARAYSDAARSALTAIRCRPLVTVNTVSVDTEYAYRDRIERLCEECGARIESEGYDVSVRLVISCPTSRLDELIERIVEITSGSAMIDAESRD